MTDETLPLTSLMSPGAKLARLLAYVYALLVVVGAIVLKLPGASIAGNELSVERAIFTSVNAATLTGFQQARALDEYGASGKACILTLTVAGTLLSLMIGGLAISRALDRDDPPGDIVWSVLFWFVFCIGVGTALMLESTRGLLDSATQAISAFGNSGLYLGKLPGATDWRTHLPLMPLALLGGLSVPVLRDLTDAIFARNKLSVHSIIVISWLAGLYLVGFVLLSAWGLRGEDGNFDFLTTVAAGSTLSLNARTCGLPIVSTASASRVAQWALIVLMSIGAAPGGVAGGFKVTSLYHLWRGTRSAMRGERAETIDGRGMAWMFAYVAAAFVIFLSLLAALPEMAADRLAFLASSALSNCGLAHEPVVLTGAGLWVIVLAMLLGRAASLWAVWWMVGAIRKN